MLVPSSVQRIADLADENPLVALGVTLVLCVISWFLINTVGPKPIPDEEEQVLPRNFTREQLKEFVNAEKGIYVAVKREVFDVSAKEDMYGPEAAYHVFAGREASRALAKMALEGPDLDSDKVDDLSFGEREQLDGWYDKFKHYNAYPVRGRVVDPPKPRSFTSEELSKYNGQQAVPEGYAAAPLYVAVKGKVYDVTFGNLAEMYLPGGPYVNLAGRDGNRALGKMSLKPEDMFSRDLSDLTDEQHKTLQEWADKFAERYPCVGKLAD